MQSTFKQLDSEKDEHYLMIFYEVQKCLIFIILC